MVSVVFFFSSRRRHTRCALVTGVQTCALPIFPWSQKKEEKRSFNGGRKAAKMGIDFAEVPVERHIHKRRRPRFGSRIDLDFFFNNEPMELRQTLHIEDLIREVSGETRCVEQACQRSEEHQSELQSLVRISYAVFCFK